MKTAEWWIDQLKLLPHPEGGYFREVYRSDLRLPQQALPLGFGGNRAASTAIFYLLNQGDFSAFHRIKSDEVWHHYDGGALEIVSIDAQGELKKDILGKAAEGSLPLVVIPADTWFAARPAADAAFVLAGCTVAPGFDFEDFEMGSRNQLLSQFPQHLSLISNLTR
jgi:hypothetical protein